MQVTTLQSRFVRPNVFIRALAATAMTCAAVFDPVWVLAADVDSLRDKLRGGEASEQTAAAASLGGLGALAVQAVPDLIAAIGSSDLAVQYESVVALGRIGPAAHVAVPKLTELLSGDSALLRRASIESLGKIGPRAQPAVPKLRELIAHDDAFISVPAAWALVGIVGQAENISAEVVPVLMKGLASSSDDVRRTAAAALAELGGEAAVSALSQTIRTGNTLAVVAASESLSMMGTTGKDALPALATRLKSERNLAGRWNLVRAVGSVGGDDPAAVSAVKSQLKDAESVVRVHALYAAGALGPNAGSLVPDIAEALDDPEPAVRRAAATALGEIGPGAVSAVDALGRAFGDREGVVTLAAAEALARIGQPAVPVLAKQLEDPAFQTLAAHVLAQIGPAAAAAVPELAELLESDDEETAMAAYAALGMIGEETRVIGPELHRILREGASPRRRAGAIYTLTKLGDETIVPQLSELLSGKTDPILQLAASWSLVTFTPDDADLVQQALPVLASNLNHPRPNGRRELIALLARLGASAEPAVPSLVDVVRNDPVPEVRADALAAIGEIGTVPEASIGEVVNSLTATEQSVRFAAAFALGRLQKAGRAGVPQLEAMAASHDRQAQTVAAWALARLEPPPARIRAAVPLMIAASESPRPAVRAEAAAFLGQFGEGNSQATATLAKLSHDEEETVRDAAKKALAANKK